MATVISNASLLSLTCQGVPRCSDTQSPFPRTTETHFRFVEGEDDVSPELQY